MPLGEKNSKSLFGNAFWESAQGHRPPSASSQEDSR